MRGFDKGLKTSEDAMINKTVMNTNQRGIISKTTQIESVNYIYQLYISPELNNSGKLPLIVFLHALHERGSSGFHYVTKYYDTCLAYDNYDKECHFDFR